MSGAPANTPDGSGAFYEIRRYRAHPGRRAGPAVLALMDASAGVVTRAVPTSASPLQ